MFAYSKRKPVTSVMGSSLMLRYAKLAALATHGECLGQADFPLHLTGDYNFVDFKLKEIFK